METTDFFSSSELEEIITNRKKDVEKNKINWHHIRPIRYLKNDIFTLYLNDSITVNIQKKFVDKKEFTEHKLPILWPNGRAINAQKFNDLMQLLRFIPNEFHKFYQDLSHNDQEKDFGLASDDDME